MWAAAKGNMDILQLLIESGAHINSKDQLTQATALMHAAYAGHKNAVWLLIRAGAEMTHRDEEGSTAEAYAFRGGYPSIAQLLRCL